MYCLVSCWKVMLVPMTPSSIITWLMSGSRLATPFIWSIKVGELILPVEGSHWWCTLNLHWLSSHPTSSQESLIFHKFRNNFTRNFFSFLTITFLLFFVKRAVFSSTPKGSARTRLHFCTAGVFRRRVLETPELREARKGGKWS